MIVSHAQDLTTLSLLSGMPRAVLRIPGDADILRLEPGLRVQFDEQFNQAPSDYRVGLWTDCPSCSGHCDRVHGPRLLP